MIPFAASARFYGLFLADRTESEYRVRGRDRARTLIMTPDGAERLLSVPVAGGSAALKHAASDPPLSSHGKWRAEHLGAWNAAYGRSPYFIHLFPEIENIYRSIPDGQPLSAFNLAFHRLAMRWLECGLPATLPPHADNRAKEVARLINPGLSIFDAIFRFGKETAMALRASDITDILRRG